MVILLALTSITCAASAAPDKTDEAEAELNIMLNKALASLRAPSKPLTGIAKARNAFNEIYRDTQDLYARAKLSHTSCATIPHEALIKEEARLGHWIALIKKHYESATKLLEKMESAKKALDVLELRPSHEAATTYNGLFSQCATSIEIIKKEQIVLEHEKAKIAEVLKKFGIIVGAVAKAP